MKPSKTPVRWKIGRFKTRRWFYRQGNISKIVNDQGRRAMQEDEEEKIKQRRNSLIQEPPNSPSNQ